MLAAPWPDDWDGVGFVRAVRAFDVGAFVPHAPGYPGWVLSARAVRWALPVGDARAASLVSALGAGMLVGSLALLGREKHAGPWLAALFVGAPLAALAGTSAGTDLAGLGWASFALACVLRVDSLGRTRWALAGAGAAMALAVRPSGLPVACALAGCGLWAAGVRAPSRRAAAGFAAGFAAVGLVCAALVRAHHGWDAYLDACVAQWRGHFGAWGNAATTDARVLARAARFAWNAAVDGAGIDASASGALRAALLFAAVVAGVRALDERARGAWAAFVLIASAWGIFAQNVSSPRHALPVMVALVWAAAQGLARHARSPGARAVAVAGCALWALPTVGLLRAHQTREPPGLALARGIASTSPDALLLGGRAARFGELAGLRTLPRTWMGEVDTTLERLDRLPRAIYLTHEVRHRARARGDVRWVGTACRDPRLERGRDACVSAYEYRPR